jgi:prepilin-type N-terminal cleavage/methylation domain-containing protein
MLKRLLTKPAAAQIDERGYSLVELLVVMAAGTVVMLTLFMMLDVTLRQTTRTFTKVSATQAARTTLERIENELHSACVASGTTPIQGGASGSQDSDANNLVFVSYYGTAANPTPLEHKISFSGGSLIDYTYNVNGGTAPNWTFSPTVSSTTTLLPNVAASGTTAIFQYFAYEPYTDGNGNTDMMLMDGTSPVPGTTSLPNPDPLATTNGLAASDAEQTAEIVITLQVGADVKAGEVGAQENSTVSDTKATVTDSIVLRFVTTPNQAGSDATFGPCS